MESQLLQALERRVLVFDGAMGPSVHDYNLPLSDYDGHENCTEILCRTRPDVVREIHARFLAAGCDAIETNSFGSNKIGLGGVGPGGEVRTLNRLAAQIARDAC